MPFTLSAPSKPIFTKTRRSHCAASSAWNSRLFLPLFPPLCHACCAGYNNTKTTSNSRSCHFIVPLVLASPMPQKWIPRSLVTSPHVSTVRFLVSSCIQTIHVCTIFSPRNYPSSVQLVRSLLSCLE